MGLTHFDEAPTYRARPRPSPGPLDAARDRRGMRERRRAPDRGPGRPLDDPGHEHGREEEIFYVLAGRGISLHRGRHDRGRSRRLHRLRRQLRRPHPVRDRAARRARVRPARVRREPRISAAGDVARRLAGGRERPYAVDRAPIQFVKEARAGAARAARASGSPAGLDRERRRRRADPRAARPCGAHTPAGEPCGGVGHHRPAARGRRTRGGVGRAALPLARGGDLRDPRRRRRARARRRGDARRPGAT